MIHTIKIPGPLKLCFEFCRQPKPLDEGGGMYAHEHAYHSVRGWWQRTFSPAPKADSEAAATPKADSEAAATASPEAFTTLDQVNSETVKKDGEGTSEAEPASSKVKPPAPWSSGG